jgi:hypothetical protein
MDPSTSPKSSACEHAPAEVVSLSLIVDDEVTNRGGQLLPLPAALTNGGRVSLLLCCCAGRSDRAGRRSQVVSCHMGNSAGLPRGKGGELRRAAPQRSTRTPLCVRHSSASRRKPKPVQRRSLREDVSPPGEPDRSSEGRAPRRRQPKEPEGDGPHPTVCCRVAW